MTFDIIHDAAFSKPIMAISHSGFSANLEKSACERSQPKMQAKNIPHFSLVASNLIIVDLSVERRKLGSRHWLAFSLSTLQSIADHLNSNLEAPKFILCIRECDSTGCADDDVSSERRVNDLIAEVKSGITLWLTYAPSIQIEVKTVIVSLLLENVLYLPTNRTSSGTRYARNATTKRKSLYAATCEKVRYVAAALLNNVSPKFHPKNLYQALKMLWDRILASQSVFLDLPKTQCHHQEFELIRQVYLDFRTAEKTSISSDTGLRPFWDPVYAKVVDALPKIQCPREQLAPSFEPQKAATLAEIKTRVYALYQDVCKKEIDALSETFNSKSSLKSSYVKLEAILSTNALPFMDFESEDFEKLKQSLLYRPLSRLFSIVVDSFESRFQPIFRDVIPVPSEASGNFVVPSIRAFLGSKGDGIIQNSLENMDFNRIHEEICPSFIQAVEMKFCVFLESNINKFIDHLFQTLVAIFCNDIGNVLKEPVYYYFSLLEQAVDTIREEEVKDKLFQCLKATILRFEEQFKIFPANTNLCLYSNKIYIGSLALLILADYFSLLPSSLTVASAVIAISLVLYWKFDLVSFIRNLWS